MSGLAALKIESLTSKQGVEIVKNNNVQILKDTLSILKRGKYKKNGKTVYTKLSRKQMEECKVYLPDDIQNIMESKEFEHIHVMGRVSVGCRNIDSFGMAQEQYKYSYLCSGREEKNILVLNFANPVNPGGGVRRGARAQEEDLCRKSSLLLSLESDDAQNYYRYNKSLHTYMGSDAIILTPNVEIIRDINGELLDESMIVSVMTCAAPMLAQGMERINDEQYKELFYNRICGMLKCAAYWGYQVLVLGAFGCGAFGNDAKVVSDLFYKALKEFDYDGMKVEDFFRRIDFAVLDRTPGQYNFNEFNRNFEHFYRDEDSAEIDQLDIEAAQLAAITHGHSLGYISAAVLCHIINRIVFPGKQKMSLKEIVIEAKNTVENIFKGDKHLQELTDIIERAIVLSENEKDDLENIRSLGQGWVAEETLAIAIYCSLKYTDDFSKGIIASVNHSGDSDSTGAVTGNILGALVGYGKIDDKWKYNLECSDVILEIADDICHGCLMSEYSSYYDEAWVLKYMNMQRVEEQPPTNVPSYGHVEKCLGRK